MAVRPLIIRTLSGPWRWIGVLLPILVVALWKAEGQTAQPAWTGKNVWAEAMTDNNGNISADGRLLTFVNWGTAELWIRDLGNGTNRPLVRGRASFYESFISPDGTHVAYNWSTGSLPELSIVPVADGNPRTIDTGRSYTFWVQGWTPDGRSLLVVKTETTFGSGEIGLINVQTSRFRRIGSVEPGTTARLSPDGAQIVLSELAKENLTQRDIRLIDVESGRSEPLLTGAADDYAPDWSPDGETIYFLSDRDNKARLWKLPLARGAREAAPLHEIPDGADRIIGVTRDDQIFVGSEDVGGTNSYVADVDWRTGAVHGIRPLPNPPLRGSRRAVLSPDAEQVAFLRRPRGYGVRPGWQIPVVQSVDGRRERVYTTTLTIRDEPVWFPDGRALLFPVPPEGSVGNDPGRRWRFMRLDLEHGAYSEIGNAAAEGQVRVGGLLGDELYYLLRNSLGSSVMSLNLRTGDSRELYKHSGEMGDAVVSPNRQRIAFVAGEPDRTVGVFIVALSSPQPARLVSLQPDGGVSVMWFSDGSAVLTSGRIDGQPGMWRIPIQAGPPVRLKLDFDDVTEVRASTDGRRVAFTRRFQRHREVWEYRSTGRRDRLELPIPIASMTRHVLAPPAFSGQ